MEAVDGLHLLSRETATYEELRALLLRHAWRRDFPVFRPAARKNIYAPDDHRINRVLRWWDAELIVSVPLAEMEVYSVFELCDTFAGFEHLYNPEPLRRHWIGVRLAPPPPYETFTYVEQRPSPTSPHVEMVFQRGFVDLPLTGRGAPPIPTIWRDSDFVDRGNKGRRTRNASDVLKAQMGA